MTTNTNSYQKMILRIPMIGIVLGASFFLVNWLCTSEMSILKYYTSEYVHTSIGTLTTIGFVITGISIALYAYLERNLKLITIFYYIYGITWIMLAVFPADTRTTSSTIGLIHTIVASACFFLFLVIFILGVITDRKYRTPLLYLLFLLDITGLLLMTFNKAGMIGIYQRIYIFVQLGMMEIIIKSKGSTETKANLRTSGSS